MERDAIRLECLRLAHVAAWLPGDVVHRARAYEDYVVGESEKVKPQPPDKKQSGDKRQKSGNVDLFD